VNGKNLPVPRYAVRYLAAAGAVRDTVVEVERRQAIAVALRVRSVDILTLTELEGDARRTQPAARLGAGARGGRFPVRAFCQELASLLESGIALYEALQTLREKERNGHVGFVLSQLVERLAQGQTFSQALAGQPEVFNPLFIATIEASQRTGQIPHALRRHAEYLAWLGALRDKLIAASIYPAMLIVAGMLVVAFLTVFVLPRFALIYADLGGELPWGTRVLMQVGQAVGDHPFIVVLSAPAALGAGVAAWRSSALRGALAARLWQTPYVGERVRLMELAALYRTLGLLLQAGVPVMAALQASAAVVGAAARAAVETTRQRVAEGARLSDSLEAEDLGTPVSLRMLRVGESSGELGAMLERAARFYDEELVRFTEWIGKVVNPALMLIMGVLVGGIVVLMYLPIFQVAEMVQ
jgi:general secretion pathway protein F